MLAHPVRTIVWGVTWRWSILFLSLIAPAPPAATIGVAVLLGIGLVASIWRRADLLGSTWRILLAVTIVNLGFWLGSPLLVPAITLAIIATLGDLWWSIAGPALERGRADRVATAVPAEVAVSAVAPNEPYLPVPRPAPILTLAPLALPERVDESRRRRASRGRMPAGVPAADSSLHHDGLLRGGGADDCVAGIAKPVGRDRVGRAAPQSHHGGRPGGFQHSAAGYRAVHARANSEPKHCGRTKSQWRSAID